MSLAECPESGPSLDSSGKMAVGIRAGLLPTAAEPGSCRQFANAGACSPKSEERGAWGEKPGAARCLPRPCGVPVVPPAPSGSAAAGDAALNMPGAPGPGPREPSARRR